MKTNKELSDEEQADAIIDAWIAEINKAIKNLDEGVARVEVRHAERLRKIDRGERLVIWLMVAAILLMLAPLAIKWIRMML